MVCRKIQFKAYILHLKAYKIDLPKFKLQNIGMNSFKKGTNSQNIPCFCSLI